MPLPLRRLLLLAVALLGVSSAPATAQRATRGAKAKSRAKATIVKPVSRAKARTKAKAAPAAAAIHWTSPSGADALATDLGAMLDRASRGGRWGVMVVSLSRGDTLFTRNGDQQLLPASTMKLYTSALAFDRFGANGRFSTDVLRDGALGADGTVRGNLYLRGAGDPALSERAGGETPLHALARTVAATGVRRVTGDLVGDASAFEDRGVPEGWRRRYLGAKYAARVSALSFNENVATVVVRAENGRAVVRVTPDAEGFPVRSNVKVVAGSRSARIGVRQTDDGLIVSGSIGSRSAPRSYAVVLEDPALYTTGAFRAALRDAGVQVDGTLRLATTPVGSARVATLPSATLATLIEKMNGESNNHFAELLFRNAARSSGVVGSAENANTMLRRFMYEKVGVEPTEVRAADGSGLSTLDRVTPRSMVKLLGYSMRAPWGATLAASLPVAGETETLRRRMKATPAQGNLRGKTGTTNDVASLGGLVTARNGETLAFAFIYNGSDRWRAKSAMDAMGATLASWSRN
ncbi:MAG: D-alanyl-D-alanine carboxypeptidase/D-alanyl-D-alanine-endopeptidase [Gemmatimonadaceae bacterium]|nr:D-alanyl-D-alanine carboxypeptidase/D-alanyl-D-alanine-endopeptidase [Gemmatimonadaceae bacterium]